MTHEVINRASRIISRYKRIFYKYIEDIDRLDTLDDSELLQHIRKSKNINKETIAKLNWLYEFSQEFTNSSVIRYRNMFMFDKNNIPMYTVSVQYGLHTELSYLKKVYSIRRNIYVFESIELAEREIDLLKSYCNIIIDLDKDHDFSLENSIYNLNSILNDEDYRFLLEYVCFHLKYSEGRIITTLNRNEIIKISDYVDNRLADKSYTFDLQTLTLFREVKRIISYDNESTSTDITNLSVLADTVEGFNDLEYTTSDSDPTRLYCHMGYGSTNYLGCICRVMLNREKNIVYDGYLDNAYKMFSEYYKRVDNLEGMVEYMSKTFYLEYDKKIVNTIYHDPKILLIEGLYEMSRMDECVLAISELVNSKKIPSFKINHFLPLGRKDVDKLNLVINDLLSTKHITESESYEFKRKLSIDKFSTSEVVNIEFYIRELVKQGNTDKFKNLLAEKVSEFAENILFYAKNETSLSIGYDKYDALIEMCLNGFDDGYDNKMAEVLLAFVLYKDYLLFDQVRHLRCEYNLISEIDELTAQGKKLTLEYLRENDRNIIEEIDTVIDKIRTSHLSVPKKYNRFYRITENISIPTLYVSPFKGRFYDHVFCISYNGNYDITISKVESRISSNFPIVIENKIKSFLKEEEFVQVISSSKFLGPLLKLKSIPNYSICLSGNIQLNSFNISKIRSARLFGIDKAIATFTSLPHVLGEIESVHTILTKNNITTSLHLGENVRESSLNNESEICDLIHICCHGFSEPSIPKEFSGIVIYNETGGVSILTYLDILHRFKFSGVSIVVLSLCEGGKSKLDLGIDWISIAKAFLSVGVKFVLASPEKVDDKQTSVLMKLFYEHLIVTNNPVSSLSFALNSFTEGELSNNWSVFH